jgi:hypothetical protein
MFSFTVKPFEGAAPVMFGQPRSEVLKILGPPSVSGKGSDSWGARLEINVGYGDDGAINHIGLSPGSFELTMNGRLLWNESSHNDPNCLLTLLDPEPLERLGFLVFTRLGVATTGFHDDDPSQYAITLFPRGAWDDELTKARNPDLTKYRRSRE